MALGFDGLTKLPEIDSERLALRAKAGYDAAIGARLAQVGARNSAGVALGFDGFTKLPEIDSERLALLI
jgi:hypothetical protein